MIRAARQARAQRAAAVDDQGLAGDPARVGRGEEGDGRADVLRLAEAAQRVAGGGAGLVRRRTAPRRSGFLTTAGATALTRTAGASSAASCTVSPMSADLLTPYHAMPGAGDRPATEAMLTTAAPGCVAEPRGERPPRPRQRRRAR